MCGGKGREGGSRKRKRGLRPTLSSLVGRCRGQGGGRVGLGDGRETER